MDPKMDQMLLDEATFVVAENLRTQVRQTAGLIDPSGEIREELHDLWACNFSERTIYWRPTHPFPPFNVLTREEALFLISHESGHLLYSSDYKVPDDCRRSAFFRLWNSVEDSRIERLLGKVFPGFNRLRREFYRRYYNIHAEANNYHPVDQVGLWLLAKEHNIEESLPIEERWAKLAKEAWPRIEKVISSGRDSQAVAEAVVPIYRRIIQEMMEQELSQENDSGESESESESNSESSGGEGSGSESQDSDDSEANKSGSTRPGTGGRNYRQFDDGFTPYEVKPDDNLVMGDAPSSWEGNLKGILYGSSGYPKDLVEAVESMNRRRFVESNKTSQFKRASTGIGDHTLSPTSISLDWDRERLLIQKNITTLAHALGRVLKHNASEYWENRKRIGILHYREGYRINRGDVAIFRKRVIPGKYNYVIGLMPDISGSMNSVARSLLLVVILLAETCQKLGINFFVVPWDRSAHIEDGGVTTTSRLTHEDKDRIVRAVSSCTGGTYEASGLYRSFLEFRKAGPEAKKLLISITDGETLFPEDSKALLSDIHNMGVVSVAVGIRTTPFTSSFYKEAIRINDVSEMIDLLPSILRKHIRKERR